MKKRTEKVILTIFLILTMVFTNLGTSLGNTFAEQLEETDESYSTEDTDKEQQDDGNQQSDQEQEDESQQNDEGQQDDEKNKEENSAVENLENAKDSKDSAIKVKSKQVKSVVQTASISEKVAIINETSYSSLQDAINAVSEEDEEITLLKDVTECVNIKNKKVTLNLDGHNITGDEENTVVTIESSTVEIKNGTITNGYTSKSSGGSAISASSLSTLTLSSITFTGNKGNGYIIYINNNSPGKVITMDKITVEKNNSKILYLRNVSGTDTIKNSIFTENSGTGKALYFYGSATRTIENCKFSNNEGFEAILFLEKPWIYFGSNELDVSTEPLTSIEHSDISNNKVTRSTVDIDANCRVNFENTTIKNNESSSNIFSAGLYVGGECIVNYNSGALYDNVNAVNNSEIYVYGGNLTLLAAEDMQDEGKDLSNFAWIDIDSQVMYKESTKYTGIKKLELIDKNAKNIIAQIGDQEYESLQEAIKSAKDGNIIKIVARAKNISCDYVYAPTAENQTITIDLNGHTVTTTNSNSNLFYIRSNSKLILVNSSDSDANVNGRIRNYGEFEFNDKVNINNWYYLNNSDALLNGKTDYLNFYTVQTTTATIGDNFEAQTINFWMDNSSVVTQLNSDEASNDVVIFNGGNEEIASKIILSSSVFTNKALVVKYKEDDNTIVIHKEIAIYLNGKSGSDENSGTLDSPVKTFSKAIEIYEANPDKYECIYITGTVTVSKDENWDGKNVAVYRYSDLKDNLVDVTGTLSLTNITFDGRKNLVKDANSIIKVSETLNIGEGSILQNNDVSQKKSGSLYVGGGGAVYVTGNGIFNMTDGIIQNNKAVLGGGVEIDGKNAVFNMSGGTIRNNSAVQVSGAKQASGGGIAIIRGATMNLIDGLITQNNTDIIGGGIAVGGINEWTIKGYNTSSLNMRGGAISNNTSLEEGGGIYIQCNGKATITKGTISENYSKSGSFGGGGIYVNGGYDLADGILHLNNVIITNNKANEEGGGIAGCPTSNLQINLGNGGAIYGNSANTANEIYTSNGIYGLHAGTSAIQISPFMLGCGSYLWKTEDGEPIDYSLTEGLYNVSLHNEHKDEDKEVQKAKKLATVYIIENTSDTKGGGIGTNGKIVIGNYDEEVVSISGEKVWNTNIDKTDSIRFTVEKKNEDETYEPVAYQTVTANDDWKYTFENLPKYDEQDEQIEYRIVEDSTYKVVHEGETIDDTTLGDIYESTSEYDSDNEIWQIFNSDKLISVDVTKTWNDAYNNDGIRPEKIEVELLANGTKVKTVEITAEDDWKYSFENLPKTENWKDIVYTVSEGAIEGYETQIEGYDIINTHIPETISVKGNKTWDDKNNQDGIRPESIKVGLFVHGINIKTVEVTSEDNWEYEFSDLPKFLAGQEIVYAISEVEVAGYESKIEGYNITNIHKPTTPTNKPPIVTNYPQPTLKETPKVTETLEPSIEETPKVTETPQPSVENTPVVTETPTVANTNMHIIPPKTGQIQGGVLGIIGCIVLWITISGIVIIVINKIKK